LLALFALAVLAPLLYLPGALIARALAASRPLSLELVFERVVLGALLNGWLAPPADRGADLRGRLRT
jgi:hypothetical protein